jgi:oxygen-independent coproporphyrinogen-3 oxidase
MLGRGHDVAQAVAALRLARSLFARVSFDLIYARPGQSLEAWEQELNAALAFGCDHFSLYQLTIEPGTVFEGRHRRGELTLPDDDHAASLYELTGIVAARAGLGRYEVSNYARPGAESRHNLSYWRYGDYAGVGPGAHGRLTLGGRLVATRRHRAPEPWAELVERHGHGSGEDETLDALTRAREALLMGLRLTEGVDAARFAARTGVELDDALDQDVLRRAEQAGYVVKANGRLTALPAGLQRLDALLPALLL